MEQNAPNLDVEDGLLSCPARTEFAPKSCLWLSFGVKGLWVDWTRSDCLASRMFSEHVFFDMLECEMKGQRIWCFSSMAGVPVWGNVIKKIDFLYCIPHFEPNETDRK